jgi:hypothetical protein
MRSNLITIKTNAFRIVNLSLMFVSAYFSMDRTLTLRLLALPIMEAGLFSFGSDQVLL